MDLRRAATAAWVAVVGGGALLTSLGAVPGPWPFVDWPMFSEPGPRTSDRVLPVAVLADGTDVPLEGDRLPGAYRTDALQAVWPRLDDDERALLCGRVLADLRDGAPGAAVPPQARGDRVVAVRLEEWDWRPLERDADDVTAPADLTRTVLLTCGDDA